MQDFSALVLSLHKSAKEYAQAVFEATSAEDILVVRIGSEKAEVVNYAEPGWPPAGNLWFKIESILNTGERYELVSPGILFREALLYYMLSERGVDIYKTPIAGSIIVETSQGAVRWDVTAPSRRDAVTLSRHVRGGPKIIVRE
jgi:hypothetical protein